MRGAQSGVEPENRELVDERLDLRADHANVADASGNHGVPEFQAKAQSSDDILLDGRAAPGATIDGHPLR